MNEAADGAIDLSIIILLCVWWAFVTALDQLSSLRGLGQESPITRTPAGCGSTATTDNPVYAEFRSIDPAFRIETFLSSAECAYETILQAYARGDLETLNTLLSEEVLQAFARACVEREKRGETLELLFVSMKSAVATRAVAELDRMEVDVLFKAEIMSVTRSAAGEIVQGSSVQLINTADLWTFSRWTASGNRSWVLIATDTA